MKTLLPALIVLSANWCAPAFATPPSQGSKVVVPPLITQVASKKSSAQPMIVRLPTQAGKVSKMITTNLVAKGPSWIALGDKYYSLCVPNRRMVACAPIVATSVMKGIDVGAVAGTKGEPLITFKMDTVGMTPKRAAYAINYFLARINKQAAHFNRMAVSYAPTPQQNALTVGPTSNLVSGGSGGACVYDDDGGMDCTGGSYEDTSGGGGGAGYGGTSDPIPGAGSTPNEPAPQCEGNCDYPSGNNNGENDPCIAPDGSRICSSPSEIPSVPVTGQRPAAEEPMSMPTCRPTGPNSIQCGSLPPVIGGGMEQLPKAPAPWFPQSWCNNIHFLCSEGQEPDNDRGDNSSTSGKTVYELYSICEAIEEVERDVCRANKGGMDNRSLTVCMEKARDRKLACYATARSLTGNGSYPAP